MRWFLVFAAIAVSGCGARADTPLLTSMKDLEESLNKLTCTYRAIDALGCTEQKKCERIVFDAYVNVCMKHIKKEYKR